jgi:hypothetical protein
MPSRVSSNDGVRSFKFQVPRSLTLIYANWEYRDEKDGRNQTYRRQVGLLQGNAVRLDK